MVYNQFNSCESEVGEVDYVEFKWCISEFLWNGFWWSKLRGMWADDYSPGTTGSKEVCILYQEPYSLSKKA